MKRPVVFLDRDGVLSKEKSYVCCAEDMEIFPYARQAVKIIKALGYFVVVVTNQSGVARGFFGEEELVKMNLLLQREVGVDAIYYCPHYPPHLNKEEDPPYLIHCDCRKPGDGLMRKAALEFDLDLGTAWFVGDRASDVEAGQAIGAKTVLLESGYGSARLEKNVVPDFIFADLTEFAKYLVKDTRG